MKCEKLVQLHPTQAGIEGCGVAAETGERDVYRYAMPRSRPPVLGAG